MKNIIVNWPYIKAYFVAILLGASVFHKDIFFRKREQKILFHARLQKINSIITCLNLIEKLQLHLLLYIYPNGSGHILFISVVCHKSKGIKESDISIYNAH